MTRDPQEHDDVGTGLKTRDESEDSCHYQMGGVPIRNGRQAGERVSDD